MANRKSYWTLPFSSVDVTWPLPNFNGKHRLWKLSSAFIIPTVGIFSKVMAGWLNRVTVHNRGPLLEALDRRAPTKPLITVSNHYSCLDDPLLWGLLDLRHLLNAKRMRWSLGANDVCFTNELHALFFSLGRTVPIIRGNGVYQKAMDFVLERLNGGDWLHIFPEGGVNVDKEFKRFKWGVGRLIAECQECPIVIPMFHLGMDDVLPNDPPYIPKFGKRVTVVIGKPIELDWILATLKTQNYSSMELRRTITEIIQNEMKKLQAVAQSLHESASPQPH